MSRHSEVRIRRKATLVKARGVLESAKNNYRAFWRRCQGGVQFVWVTNRKTRGASPLMGEVPRNCKPKIIADDAIKHNNFCDRASVTFVGRVCTYP